MTTKKILTYVLTTIVLMPSLLYSASSSDAFPWVKIKTPIGEIGMKLNLAEPPVVFEKNVLIQGKMDDTSLMNEFRIVRFTSKYSYEKVKEGLSDDFIRKTSFSRELYDKCAKEIQSYGEDKLTNATIYYIIKFKTKDQELTIIFYSDFASTGTVPLHEIGRSTKGAITFNVFTKQSGHWKEEYTLDYSWVSKLPLVQVDKLVILAKTGGKFDEKTKEYIPFDTTK